MGCMGVFDLAFNPLIIYHHTTQPHTTDLLAGLLNAQKGGAGDATSGVASDATRLAD